MASTTTNTQGLHVMAENITGRGVFVSGKLLLAEGVEPLDGSCKSYSLADGIDLIRRVPLDFKPVERSALALVKAQRETGLDEAGTEGVGERSPSFGERLHVMRHALLAGVIIGLGALPAHALPILSFGQTAGTPITATENGAQTATTLSATDAPIAITQIENGVPVNAFFDLSAASVGAAVPILGGSAQKFSGSFSITSSIGGTGTNYLSGTFADVTFGSGAGGALAVGAPPDALTLTSDVITSLLQPSAVGLAFANITPGFSIVGTSIGSFTSSVSGTFSASAVPEPATLALLGVGLLGLGLVRQRRA